MLPILLAVLAQSPDVGVTTTPSNEAQWVESSGFAAVAPASLSAGNVSASLLLGAPELSMTYRQGFSFGELDGTAAFDYFHLSLALEGGVRARIAHRERFDFAALGAIGIEFNPGNQYLDAANFSYVGVRPRFGFVGSYTVFQNLAVVGAADLRVTFPLGRFGTVVRPTISAGGEFQLGGPFTAILMGEIGVDATTSPLNVLSIRPAWGVRAGFGMRLF